MLARSAATVVALVTLVVSLAGCSLLNPGPARDAEGAVLERTVTAAQYLVVGDCFSFPDPNELSRVEVTPCDTEHTHTVIAQGVLTDAAVESAGGRQNAVSEACAASFGEFVAAFEAAAGGGSRPEQQFIVSQREVDGEQLLAYSCTATDAVAIAAG